MWNARLLAGTEQNTLKEGVVDLQLQHFVRVGLQVAEAVAAAIEEQEDRKYRPVLLRIQSGEKGESPEYRFEGGTVVQVNMLDMDQFTEYWRKPHREQWVVTHCNVRYWKGSDVSYGLAQRREEGKISEIWGPEKLLEIKDLATRTNLASHFFYVFGKGLQDLAHTFFA